MVCKPCTDDPRVLLGPGVRGDMSREFIVADRPVLLRAYNFRREAGGVVVDEAGIERPTLPTVFDCARVLSVTDFCGAIYVGPATCNGCELTLSYCQTQLIVALPGRYRLELTNGDLDDLLVTIDDIPPYVQVTMNASPGCGCK